MNIGSEMGKLFGKVAAGKCRLSMDGQIAIQTSSGYKTYNLKSGRLVNCDSFVFDLGDEMFFVIPTNHVRVGDIILVTGIPKCVIEVEKNKLTVLNYETNAIENILPERHVFMGSQYFYSKIVSPFGGMLGSDKKSNTNNLMKYYMMSELFKGFGSNGESGSAFGGGMGAMMAMGMLGNGSMGDMFSGIFDSEDDDEEETTEDTEG